MGLNVCQINGRKTIAYYPTLLERVEQLEVELQQLRRLNGQTTIQNRDLKQAIENLLAADRLVDADMTKYLTAIAQSLGILAEIPQPLSEG